MNKKSLLFGLAAVTLLTACSNGQDSKTDATNNGKEVTASVTEDIHGDIFLYDSMLQKLLCLFHTNALDKTIQILTCFFFKYTA